MTPFSAPVEDILFSLEHVAQARRLPGWDSHLVREIVQHFAQFAESEIAPLDEPGDVEGCRLENGRVRMPAGFIECYRAFAEQGWPSLTANEAHGGQGMPAPVQGAITEIFAGACHSLQMVVGLVPCAVQTLVDFGAKAQQDRFLPQLVSGKCLATMALTEPAAGSDLSGIRTRAARDDGRWRITGEKIFISGGDQDLSDGILHMVLARTGAAEPGTAGLSLLICPSHREDGSRNAVSVTRIEEKMGLHASPTCQMVFDGAAAELVGTEGAGLKAMFTMMNHARLDVALQGVAHAARAQHIARAYASERAQGRSAAGMPVTIDQHADVARMLRDQDALAIGGRALCHIALVALASGDAPDLVAFLTPVCKVLCTEAGIRSADLGIQVLGGYGYLREYRVEQTLRDARATSIYEGANGIHAMALATRSLRHREGAAAEAFAGFVRGVAEGDRAGEALRDSLALWQEARQTVLALSDPGQVAHDFMELTGWVAFQAAWRVIASRAGHAADAGRLETLAGHVSRRLPTTIRALTSAIGHG
jgi:alkylation response protein AidB-like acyl-CoA dehydrogenase